MIAKAAGVGQEVWTCSHIKKQKNFKSLFETTPFEPASLKSFVVPKYEEFKVNAGLK